MKPFGWSLISSFALTAAGSPIGAPGMMLNGRASASVSSDMLATFELYSQYAGASYCNSGVAIGSTVTCSGNACPDVTAAGAKVTGTFVGSATDIQGFVSTDEKNQVIVLSVRGSHSIRNWITDLEFIQTDCSGLVSGCKVHSGFAKAWDEISDAALSAVRAAKDANPAYKIVFTGHSLGGAVSSLGAQRKASSPERDGEVGGNGQGEKRPYWPVEVLFTRAVERDRKLLGEAHTDRIEAERSLLAVYAKQDRGVGPSGLGEHGMGLSGKSLVVLSSGRKLSDPPPPYSASEGSKKVQMTETILRTDSAGV
ncbi:hypothetical protein EKO27_g7336 [Xylaria grammica]|uniref:Fungal lipase-type domain-containing protein n=1 Tax=Xylaria grammica TaxID=363999 RepID=A0A439D017_9PEZI|nr:hypothetical protein EKO27_g7336 [Xylaria grammica]